METHRRVLGPIARPYRRDPECGNRTRCAASFLLAAIVFAAHPAQAQVSGSITIASDDRFRGRSLSSGRAVASLTLAYDDPSGLYVDGTAAASSAPDTGIVLTRAAVDAGYAWRTTSGVSFDVGVTHLRFTRFFSGGRVNGYSEIYAGAVVRDWSARLSYSPDYFARGSHTLYLTVDRAIRLSPAWRLTAHAGAIAYLSPIRVQGLRSIEYDYAAGIARRWGPLDLSLTLSSGGPDRDFYARQPHAKTSLVASATIAF